MPVYLRSLRLLKENMKQGEAAEYPFHIDSIQSLEELTFESSVTFFVGENGSGKSTLLEAIAYQCGFHTAGGSRNNFYNVYASESILGPYIRLSWLPKITRGFFLRAETFYNFSSHIDDIGARGAYGNKSLHAQSHGESFWSLFKNRFTKKGIYLLDEPEAALSPTRQLSFLRLIDDMVKEGESQFIIATHSPIILGYPNAQIFNFDTKPISKIAYEETIHYIITKKFLENRDGILAEILAK
ncbi:AAA family ATPase [Microaerobacter geothermalis]|uniref:AAA family ATPase n=1 Tax=Microaerobacter geothermalis TaxID=674972 RepID=UPI001F40D8EC|nr:AAA family ATPase [Microaerobacter geothermalis]MCF6095359.1 AAA family ATPase [Microaerobacter geothermalis]